VRFDYELAESGLIAQIIGTDIDNNRHAIEIAPHGYAAVMRICIGHAVREKGGGLVPGSWQ